MDESQLRSIKQIEQFLGTSADVAFTSHGGDLEHYVQISLSLPHYSQHNRGVQSVPAYLMN